MQQVFLNLITNAVDAMRAVTNRPRVLSVRSAASGADHLSIAVEDSGPGIDSGHVDRIFDAFFTTKSHGMGMGLAICRSIVEAHRRQPLGVGGGAARLGVPPRSAMWRLRIFRRRIAPIMSTSAAPIDRDHERDGGGMNDEHSGPQSTVYVVDDDAAVRRGLSNLIRSVGLRVEVFASASEFLAAKRPDAPCLILDVRMPGLSGLDFQAELTKARNQFPIIFITGHADFR